MNRRSLLASLCALVLSPRAMFAAKAASPELVSWSFSTEQTVVAVDETGFSEDENGEKWGTYKPVYELNIRAVLHFDDGTDMRIVSESISLKHLACLYGERPTMSQIRAAFPGDFQIV